MLCFTLVTITQYRRENIHDGHCVTNIFDLHSRVLALVNPHSPIVLPSHAHDTDARI